MADSSNQKNADNKSGDKKGGGQTQQIQTGQANKAIKATLTAIVGDDTFRFIASIAIVSWMIHEFVFDSHKIFLFLAIAFGLADAVYVLGHKIVKGIIWATLWWAVYVACLVAIFRNEAQPQPEQPILVQHPDLIPDTKFSFEHLERIFPFGYDIIYPNEHKCYSYENDATGRIQWTINWKTVQFAPDFRAGTVAITVTDVSQKGTGANTFEGSNSFTGVFTFKNGQWGIIPIPTPRIGPTIYGVILSADQANPVVAIGFRMESPIN